MSYRAQPDDVYGTTPAPAPDNLPLFGGPFEDSNGTPTPTEKEVAELIWAASRTQPIPLKTIAWRVELSDREVKGIVEQLRITHHCQIGASREEPSGYFWIRSEADREVAVRPYREQLLSMMRTLRVLESPDKLQKLYARLTEAE